MRPEVSPPDWLADAVRAVLADLQQPRPVPIAVSYARGRFADEESWFVLVRETDPAVQRPSTAEFVVQDDRGPMLLANLADYLQEQFFHETRVAWGESRPACPGHTHPASPSGEDDDDVAWWYCPHNGRPIAPIGQYSQQSAAQA